MNYPLKQSCDGEIAQSPQSTETETLYREEVIAYYIEEAQALILDRIVMPTIDPRFDSLCHEMAGLLGCHVSECVKILAPALRALYRATQEAADQSGYPIGSDPLRPNHRCYPVEGSTP